MDRIRECPFVFTTDMNIASAESEDEFTAQVVGVIVPPQFPGHPTSFEIRSVQVQREPTLQDDRSDWLILPLALLSEAHQGAICAAAVSEWFNSDMAERAA